MWLLFVTGHSCDGFELACSSHLSICLLLFFIFPFPSLSLFSRSTFISFNLAQLRLSAVSFTQPPPCSLLKMTECEDMMEYFLSSLWISLCVDPHTHTDTKAWTHTHTHTRWAHASYQGLLSQSNSDVIDLSRLSAGTPPHTAVPFSWDALMMWTQRRVIVGDKELKAWVTNATSESRPQEA